MIIHETFEDSGELKFHLSKRHSGEVQEGHRQGRSARGLFLPWPGLVDDQNVLQVLASAAYVLQPGKQLHPTGGNHERRNDWVTSVGRRREQAASRAVWRDPNRSMPTHHSSNQSPSTSTPSRLTVSARRLDALAQDLHCCLVIPLAVHLLHRYGARPFVNHEETLSRRPVVVVAVNCAGQRPSVVSSVG